MASDQALLPLIDLSELKPGTAEWDTVRGQVRQALQEYGCFAALFNKVSSELRKSMSGATEEIFERPLQTKSRLISPRAPLGTVYTAESPKTPWESVDIEDVLIPEILTSFINLLWPEGNPNLGNIIRSFTEQLSQMDQMIRRMVLEIFGVEKYYDEHIDLSQYILRVMRYEGPKTMESKLMLMPHADKNLWTILYQINQVGGLEVQTKDGKWIDVKSSPHSFIVMPGESFQAWTNGRVQASIHRIVMTGNETRYSVGVFSIPKGGHLVKAPDELVDEEHPLRYKPYEFLEYLRFFKTEKGRNAQKGDELKVFCGV